MNPLLEQFIQEARDFLQGIGEKLLALESDPGSEQLMTELFRLVHTLKGNSGLFEFPEMTRVLHAGEDLMDAVRDTRVAYSRDLADRLLDAMDFVGALLDEIEAGGAIDPAHAAPSSELAQGLRALIPAPAAGAGEAAPAVDEDAEAASPEVPPDLGAVPEAARLAAWRAAAAGEPLFWIEYRPEEECFFKGEDPLNQGRHTPGLLWGGVAARQPWPPLAEMDCYRCELDFRILAAAARGDLEQHYRYMPEQVSIRPLAPLALVVPAGYPNGGPVYGEFIAEALALLEQGDLPGLEAAAGTMLEFSAPDLWLASALRWLLTVLETAPGQREVMERLIRSLATLTPPDWRELPVAGAGPGAATAPQAAPEAAPAALAPAIALADEDRARLAAILGIQADILALPDGADWQPGRLRAVAATLGACLSHLGETADEVEEALAEALAAASARPLSRWLAGQMGDFAVPAAVLEAAPVAAAGSAVESAGGCTTANAPAGRSPGDVPELATAPLIPAGGRAPGEEEPKFGRRVEDAQVGKVLKVEQGKVDRLMNLIGEMVVAKNSLPYLANRAENQFGVRELSREIKAQYAVINRIAEEMQDAIMQVRMMPVSFVFQRFPRLVRDISRKLGKEVELVLEGEETEADKNIVEALADPLIHIVRNSLDHGLELPEARLAAGKPRAGRLLIRAAQESDRVVISISDDGRGIDPAVIRRKAYEKGVIDEAALERIGDQEAIQLVFAAGFSTAETVSDLSGRGVGMDVVRSAIDRVGGSVHLASEVGKGTTLKLSLPLSMAVTNVMIVESDGQIFGVPMEAVVETVRLPQAGIRTIKRQRATVLRDRIVPLVALNDLLAVGAEPRVNADDELAALVVRVGGEQVGMLVDDFREVVDVILKPLPGELARLSCYAGTALLGDGSVLMVLNPKELF